MVYKLRFKETEQEGGEGKGTRLSLEVISQAIEAKSRKLAASWTIEASQDLKEQHGENIEDEVLQAIADEMAHARHTTKAKMVNQIKSSLVQSKKSAKN